MHKASVFWLCLATVCSALLFHTSQQVTDGRSALLQLERDMRREEESLRVLKAEWSYLNQPERLEKLARQYLDLAPLTGRQFTRAADINARGDEKDTASDPAHLATAAIEPAAGKARADQPRPVIKRQPAQPPATRPVAAKAVAPTRGFNDVLKNLEAN